MYGISPVPPDRQALAAVAAGATEKPLYFNLVVRKAVGVHLGIDVSCTWASAFVKDGIFVTRVEDDSVVAAWNVRSQEPYRVRAGDFVFQVNSVHGDSIRMMQEMQAQKTLTMHVLRAEGLSLRGEDSNALHEQDDAAEDLDPEPEPVVHRQITARERHEAPPPRPGSEAVQAPFQAQPTSPDDALVELLIAHVSTLSDQAFAEFANKVMESRPHLRDRWSGMLESRPHLRDVIFRGSGGSSMSARSFRASQVLLGIPEEAEGGT